MYVCCLARAWTHSAARNSRQCNIQPVCVLRSLQQPRQPHQHHHHERRGGLCCRAAQSSDLRCLCGDGGGSPGGQRVLLQHLPGALKGAGGDAVRAPLLLVMSVQVGLCSQAVPAPKGTSCSAGTSRCAAFNRRPTNGRLCLLPKPTRCVMCCRWMQVQSYTRACPVCKAGVEVDKVGHGCSDTPGVGMLAGCAGRHKEHSALLLGCSGWCTLCG